MRRELKQFGEALWNQTLRFFGVRQYPAEPIGVVPSGDPRDDAHFDSKPYGTYVDRKGNLHDLNRIPEGSMELNVKFVAMGDVGTPFQELMEKLDQMQTITEVKNIDEMEKPSQAQVFVDKVKADHRLPDLRNARLARELNVIGFGFSWNAQGHYKLVSVDFEDQSSWESGKAYD